MKKLFIAMFSLVILLTGCGGVDYTDSQVYVKEYTSTINDYDSDLIPAAKDFLKTAGLQDSFDTMYDSILNYTDAVLDIYKDDAKDYYTKFKSGLADQKFDVSADDFTTLSKTFDALPDDMADKFADIYNKIFEGYAGALDKVTDSIKGLTPEEFEDKADALSSQLGESSGSEADSSATQSEAKDE